MMIGPNRKSEMKSDMEGKNRLEKCGRAELETDPRRSAMEFYGRGPGRQAAVEKLTQRREDAEAFYEEGRKLGTVVAGDLVVGGSVAVGSPRHNGDLPLDRLCKNSLIWGKSAHKNRESAWLFRPTN